MFNFYNKDLRIFNITHYDFDGAVSACVLKRYYRNVTVFPTTYSKEDDILKKIRNYENMIDAIIITDFFPSEKWEEIKALGYPILVLDHHESAIPWNDPKNQVYIKDEKMCGAKMTYVYFVRADKDVEVLKEFVEIANDYDLWILKDPRSMVYNQLFWSTYSFNDYVDRYKDGDITLSDLDKTKLKEWRTQVKNDWDELELTSLPNSGVLATVKRHMTDISLKLEKEGYQWMVLYSPSKHSISLRSRNEAIDLTEVTKEIGVGGGHKHAAGIPITEGKLLRDVVDSLIQIISKIQLK